MATRSAPVTEREDDQSAFLAAVDEGLADAKAGHTVAYEKVRRWMLSWGSGKETPPPKCP